MVLREAGSLMAREIHCAGCGTYLGEIRDARLRKDLVTYCQPCATEREQRQEDGGPVVDFLKGVFGGRRG